jgi:hypothetical protein
MCKFPGKIMMLAVTALILSVGTAIAGQSSADWNNSWGFPSPFEKSRLIDQALAIELVENDGFNNSSTYFGTETNHIGSQIIQIDNSINDSVLDSFNDTNSHNSSATNTSTTNINKTIQNSNNTTHTNTTNTNIDKTVNINK